MDRILVCIDGSQRGPAVVHAAVALARKVGGKLLLCRVVGIPAELPQNVWRLPQDSLYDSLRDGAQAYLSDCANSLGELVSDTFVLVGKPWSVICELARAQRVDLVVIGSHGYGALDRVVGTNAARIVNNAPCSVLVVRSSDLFEPTATTGDVASTA
jgi:universal stress protein F